MSFLHELSEHDARLEAALLEREAEHCGCTVQDLHNEAARRVAALAEAAKHEQMAREREAMHAKVLHRLPSR